MCGQLVLYIKYNCIFQHLIVCSQLTSNYTYVHHYHWQPSEVLKRRFFDEISSSMTEAITNQPWAVSIHQIPPPPPLPSLVTVHAPNEEWMTRPCIISLDYWHGRSIDTLLDLKPFEIFWSMLLVVGPVLPICVPSLCSANHIITQEK